MTCTPLRASRSKSTVALSELLLTPGCCAGSHTVGQIDAPTNAGCRTDFCSGVTSGAFARVLGQRQMVNTDQR
jgi:hypothetical protein